MLRDGESSRIQLADHLIDHLIDTQVGSIDNDRTAGDRQRGGRSRGIDAIARGDFIVLPFGTPSLLADVFAGIDVKFERCLRKDNRPNITSYDDDVAQFGELAQMTRQT